MDSAGRSVGMSSTEIETMRSVEDDLWWYRALRGHVVESIQGLRAEFDLLDAGCGTGGMLARIRERFPRAKLTGLDFSALAIELTRARDLDATLVQGSINALPFTDESFDVVVSLDVLIVGGVNESAAISEMYRVLRPNGMLILNLPAFDFLRGSHDAAVNIARRFTHSRLAALLKESGFNLEHASYWNMGLTPAIALVRWMSRRRAAEPAVRSDLKPVWPPLNAALASWTKLEFAASRNFPLPFGTSLFAVARK